MTGTALIVWSYEREKTRRTSLFHVEVQSGRKTACGRRTENWAYLTISFPALWRRVRDQDRLCSECLRLIAGYDFPPGKEPSAKVLPERKTSSRHKYQFLVCWLAFGLFFAGWHRMKQNTAMLPASDFRTNALFYGDNLQVLRRFPSECVDLHVLDPPFNSMRNYFVLFKDRTGKSSAAQEEAFMDTWNWDEQSLRWYQELLHGQANESLSVTVEALRRVLKESPMMAYLVAMAIRLVELHRTLKPTGSLYLHCDPTASHYLKIVLDVIFGPEMFFSEIIWKRYGAHGDAKRYGAVHDVILFYGKSRAARFNKQFVAYEEDYIKAKFRFVDENGRRYQEQNLVSPNPRPNLTYDYTASNGILYRSPPNGWKCELRRMQQLDAEGRLHFPAKAAGRLRLKMFLDESQGVAVQDIWTDIPSLSGTHGERLGYPTQKPRVLLERIIAASSNPGDVVCDSFCGCGTAVDAAHTLGRRWVGIDVTAVAIDIIRDRMEQRHPELKGHIPVIGFPQDLESAQRMFEEDPFGFQEWACLKIGAHPRRNKAGGTKGADAGIDGWLSFEDRHGEGHRAVVQVKGGKTSVSQVRDFCHVVQRETATLGFFVCMGDAARAITGPMRDEALGMGLWTSAGGHEYPVVQILTVKDIFEKGAMPRYPLQDKRSALGYKAKKQGKASGQLSADALFEEE